MGCGSIRLGSALVHIDESALQGFGVFCWALSQTYKALHKVDRSHMKTKSVGTTCITVNDGNWYLSARVSGYGEVLPQPCLCLKFAI